MTRAKSLRGLCGGAVYLPGGPGFDEARTPWNVAVEQRPAAIAYPANATETSQVIRAAVAAGLRVAPQSTGHNAGLLGRLDERDTFGRVPAPSLVRMHMDPEGPTPSVSNTAMLDGLPDPLSTRSCSGRVRILTRPC